MSNLSLHRTSAFVAALAIGVAVGGCASKNEPTPEEANATLCEAKTDFADTVASVGNIDPTSTTVDGLQTVRTNVREAFDEVNEAAAVVAEVEIQELRAAKDDFLEAVQGIDDRESLAASADEVRSSAAEVKAAFEAVFAKADCS
jgi:hypothetical protein